jgi:hypothetical protein
MHAGLWPAITRRQSPPSASPRSTDLGSLGCDLWLGARDPETRRHHWTGHSHLRMLIARAATSRTVVAEIADSSIINSFAQRVSGIASVGLNAIAFVKDT